MSRNPISHELSVINPDENVINNKENKPNTRDTLDNNEQSSEIINNHFSSEIIFDPSLTTDAKHYPEQFDIFPISETAITKVTFVVFGMSGVIFWSILISCNFSLFSTIYSYPSGADTVLIGYYALAVLSGIVRLKLRSMSHLFFEGSLVLFASNCILLPLCLFFITGKAGIIVTHILIGITGVTICSLLGNAFTYASFLPNGFTGFVVAGNGLASLVGFVIWQFFTRFFFDENVISEVRIAISLSFAVVLLVLVFCYILFLRLKKKPWLIYLLNEYDSSVKISLTKEEVKKAQDKSSSDPHYRIEGTRHPWTIMKEASYPLLVGDGAFFITFCLYPNIAPYAWHGLSLNSISLCVGIYMFSDAVTRFLPFILKEVQMTQKQLLITGLLRLSFFPVVLLMAYYETALTSSLYLQILVMILFSVSNGFVTSQSLASVPSYVLTNAERGLLGISVYLIMQLCFGAGTVVSKIIKLIMGI